MGLLWHPKATKNQLDNAGPFAIMAPARIVWHTTESSGLPSYSGSAPHFTLDPLTGQLWQHAPLDKAAKALRHPAGTVHTNHAHAFQVELIGFADTELAKKVGRPDRAVVNWGDDEYERIGQLARFIEQNTGVKRMTQVVFRRSSKRMAPSQWLSYNGHCGHMHVPGNDHWDPGEGFRIDLILAAKPKPLTPTQRKRYEHILGVLAYVAKHHPKVTTVDGMRALYRRALRRR